MLYISILYLLYYKKNKNKDYEYVSNIIIQLDLENININEQSFYKFESILNIEKKCIKELIECEDFNDLKKIDFFSKILIYLIKNSLYEYNIKILKTKIYELFNIDFQDILIYLIKHLYYSEDGSIEIHKKDEDKLKDILNYYKYFLFDIKKLEIIIIRYILDFKTGNYQLYLEDYEKSKKNNSLIGIIEHIKINNKKNILSEKEIEQTVKILEDISKKELNSINIKDKQSLLKYFMFNNNILQIFKKEIIIYFINDAKANLLLDECIITFNINERKDIKINIRYGQLNDKISFQELKGLKNYLTNNKNKDIKLIIC